VAKLRADATDAREALEAEDLAPDHEPEHWQALCEAVAETEARATRAEADEESRPGQQKRAKQARRGSRRRRALEEHVRRLGQIDPQLCEEVLQRLIYSAPNRTFGDAWRKLAAEVVGEAAA
jgi:hypothetical protein